MLKRLNRAPNDVALQYDAARWLIDHGHPDEGIQWALKIVAAQPKHKAANHLLATYYEKQGKQGLANFYRVQAESP